MELTPVLKLIKPTRDDSFRVGDLNANMDRIDAFNTGSALGQLDTALDVFVRPWTKTELVSVKYLSSAANTGVVGQITYKRLNNLLIGRISITGVPTPVTFSDSQWYIPWSVTGLPGNLPPAVGVVDDEEVGELSLQINSDPVKYLNGKVVITYYSSLNQYIMLFKVIKYSASSANRDVVNLNVDNSIQSYIGAGININLTGTFQLWLADE